MTIIVDEKLPRVAAVVLNYNGMKSVGPVLQKCLLSILNTDYTSFLVAFLDNGSVDRSIEYIEEKFKEYIERKRLVVIKLDKNYGWTGGNNKAIDYLKEHYGSFSYLAFLNNDILVEPSWLKNILSVMEKNERIAVAAPIMYSKEEWQGEVELGGFIYPNRNPVLLRLDSQSPIVQRISKNHCYLTVSYATGCCIVIRDRIFDELKGFDDYYFIFFDETDFCLRVWSSGSKVAVIPNSRIVHMGSVTVTKQGFVGVIDRTKTRYMCNMLYFSFKNFPRQKMPHILVNMLVWVPLTTFVRFTRSTAREAASVLYGFYLFIHDFRQAVEARRRNKFKLKDWPEGFIDSPLDKAPLRKVAVNLLNKRLIENLQLKTKTD